MIPAWHIRDACEHVSADLPAAARGGYPESVMPGPIRGDPGAAFNQLVFPTHPGIETLCPEPCGNARKATPPRRARQDGPARCPATVRDRPAADTALTRQDIGTVPTVHSPQDIGTVPHLPDHGLGVTGARPRAGVGLGPTQNDESDPACGTQAQAALDRVELMGLEPTTPCMPCRCATSCATAPGAPGGARPV